MSKAVRLTSLAKKDLADVLEYLYYKWDVQTANNFIAKFEERLITVARNPDIFPYFSKEQNLQRCVLTKHNTIYFREGATEIVVIRIFDTRQNPDKLRLF